MWPAMWPAVRRQLALLCVLLLLTPQGIAPMGAGSEAQRLPASVAIPLDQDLRGSYLTLFETAARLEYSPAQIEAMRALLKQAEDSCVGRFEEAAKRHRHDAEEAQAQLRKAGITEEQRHDLHCRIQTARSSESQSRVIAQHAIPVAYANKLAKLELIEKWPTEERTIRQALANGSYRQRRWADVEDIGFRRLEPDQKDDVKMGQEALRELKLNGMLPRVIDDEVVTGYVRNLAREIATHSDLQVPLEITVLDSKEVNAFALPGGFLFIERGLLESVEDESQLAGVIAHEISHVVLRHGRKLMRRATIASIFYQAAQIAALVLTGGAVGIGAYYALQYGFFGLGLTLNLALIGVSRDYEREADILGVQYAWAAGYDPSGFVRFFDRMATREGYVNSASWFRTHPPFFDRMKESQREMLYLGRKPQAIVETTAFGRMKEALKPIVRQSVFDAQRQKPTLHGREPSCPESDKPVYEPGKPIETICPLAIDSQPGR